MVELASVKLTRTTAAVLTVQENQVPDFIYSSRIAVDEYL